MNKEEITRKSIFMTGFRSKLTYPFSFEDLEEVGGIIDFYEEKVNQLEEDEDITKWGKGALEEIQTKKDYKINDLQKYIELLMVTQNQIIDRLDELKKGK